MISLDTKQTRIIKKTVPRDSFFNFFSPPTPPGEEEEPEEEIEERLELDYQLGEDIKEKIIPHAVSWFTGEALQYEGYEGFSDEEIDLEEEEEEDDSEEGDEEEEDSDEEVRRSLSQTPYDSC
jgi:nucleosome assembly protein 1-like 1